MKHLNLDPSLNRSVVLFGVTGQIGCRLHSRLKNAGYRVVAPCSSEVDFRSKESVVTFIDRCEGAQAIINCAAYTNVDLAESESDLAFRINGSVMADMSHAAAEIGSRIVHLSTDYVFGAARQHSPYVESDTVCPVNTYGFSKVLGEQNLQNGPAEYFIFRTSWIFDPDLNNNFFQKIRSALYDKKKISVVNDQVGRPTSARFVANRLTDIIVSDFVGLEPGIYHIAEFEPQSWFDFAQSIKRREQIFSSDPLAVIEQVSSDFCAQIAQRPRYSVLDTSKLDRALRRGR